MPPDVPSIRDYLIRVSVADQQAYERFYMGVLAGLPGLDGALNSQSTIEGRVDSRRTRSGVPGRRGRVVRAAPRAPA